MNSFPRKVVEPLLEAFKRAVLEFRMEGTGQDKIAALLDMSEELVAMQVEDAEDRAWLIARFREAAAPSHEGSGAVQ